MPALLRGFPEHNSTFPKDLNQLEYHGQHIIGATGGIYVLHDKNGNQFALKIGLDENIFKDEITTDGLYRSVGVNVPDFAIYNEISEKLATQIGAKDKKLFRLTPFIKNHFDYVLTEEQNAKINEEIAAHFLEDAFFSNWDLHQKNFILDENNVLWRIDNGSNIRYHAMGTMKAENQIVSEVENLRSGMAQNEATTVYKTLDEKTIQAQTDRLIDKVDIILESYLKLHQVLNLSEPALFEKLILNRMNHLAEHYALQINSRPNRYAIAVPNYSSASVMLLRKSDNTYEVLLGKRAKHEYYSDWGGSTEPNDKDLERTAVRELHEETNGFFQITALHGQLFHDQINETKKHRTYFVSLDQDIAHCNEVFTQPLSEHSELKWVSLSSIANALIKQTYVTQEQKKLLKVDDKNGTIVLFPQMTEAFNDPVLKEHIFNLANGIYPNKSTLNRVSSSYPFEFSDHQHLKFLPKYYPDYVKQQYANTLLHKSLLLQELKPVHPQPASETQNTRDGSISERYLDATIDSKHQHLPLKEKIQALLKMAQWNLQVNERDLENVHKMIDMEKRHTHKAIFYHTTSPEMAFLNRLFTEFRCLLDAKPNRNQFFFRPLDIAFRDKLSISAFQQKQAAQFGKIDYYNPGYAERIIAVNYFLFGNFDISSSSFYYFLADYKANPPDFEKYLTYLLGMLGIQEAHNKITHCFAQTYQKIGMVITQILMEMNVVDHIVYPARARGIPNPYQDGDKSITGYQAIVETIIEGEKNRSYRESLRGGLYLDPEVMHSDQVQVIEYHRRPLAENGMELIKKLASDLVSIFFKNENKFSTASFMRAPTLIKQLQILKQNDPYSLLENEIEIKTLIANSIFRNEPQQLETLLAHYPDFSLRMSVNNPDYISKKSTLKIIDLLEYATKEMVKVVYHYIKQANKLLSAVKIKSPKNATLLSLLVKQQLNTEVKELIDTGMLGKAETYDCLTIAFSHGNEEIYEYLLQKFPYLNTELKNRINENEFLINGQKVPILPYTVFYGNLTAVKRLIKFHPDIAAMTPIPVDNFALDILSLATYHGKTDVAQFLLPYCDVPRIERGRKVEPLLWAILSDNPSTAQLLLTHYQKNKVDISKVLEKEVETQISHNAYKVQTILEVALERNISAILECLLPHVTQYKEQAIGQALKLGNKNYLLQAIESHTIKSKKWLALIFKSNSYQNNQFMLELLALILKIPLGTQNDLKQEVKNQLFDEKNKKLLKHLILGTELNKDGTELFGEDFVSRSKQFSVKEKLSFLVNLLAWNDVPLAQALIKQINSDIGDIEKPTKKSQYYAALFNVLLSGYARNLDGHYILETMLKLIECELNQMVSIDREYKIKVLKSTIKEFLENAFNSESRIEQFKFLVRLLKTLNLPDQITVLTKLYFECASRYNHVYLAQIELLLAENKACTPELYGIALSQALCRLDSPLTIELCTYFINKISNSEMFDLAKLQSLRSINGVDIGQHLLRVDHYKILAALICSVGRIIGNIELREKYRITIQSVIEIALDHFDQLSSDLSELLVKIMQTQNDEKSFQRYLELKIKQGELNSQELSACITFRANEIFKQHYHEQIPVEETLQLCIDSKNNELLRDFLANKNMADQMRIECLVRAATSNNPSAFNLILEKTNDVSTALLIKLIGDGDIADSYIQIILPRMKNICPDAIAKALEVGEVKLAAAIYTQAQTLDPNFICSNELLDHFKHLVKVSLPKVGDDRSQNVAMRM